MMVNLPINKLILASVILARHRCRLQAIHVSEKSPPEHEAFFC